MTGNIQQPTRQPMSKERGTSNAEESVGSTLFGNDADGFEPGFSEGGPVGDRIFGGAHAEGVAAAREDMHLGGDFRFFQVDEVDDGIVDVVDGVVFGLHDERGRGVGGDGNMRIEFEGFVVVPQVAGVTGDGEIRAAAFSIGGVDGSVGAFVELRAGGGDEVAAGGKTDDADFVRGNM